MPTAYTYRILEEDGYTFKQFVKHCALSFFRDRTELPREVVPDIRYDEEAIERDRKTLKWLRGLSDEEASVEAAQSEKDSEASTRKYREVRIAENLKFDAMLEQVQAWDTDPIHNALKGFMTEQIETSKSPVDLGFDSTPLSGPEWRKFSIEGEERCIARNRQHRKKEIQRAEEMNCWLSKLHKFLETE